MEEEAVTDRLMRLRISPDVLIERFKPSEIPMIETCEGLPPDAKVVRAFIEESPLNQLPRLVLIIWSRTYDIVPEGAVIPETSVSVIRRTIGAAA